MTTRAQLVAEARQWRDTPFAHQGRTRGVGCDCGGLIGGVAVSMGLLPVAWWTETFDKIHGGYARNPSNGTLQRICETFMTQIDAETIQPGDVILMRFKREPQHLGFVGDYMHGGLSIIHALSTVGKVAEHRLSPEWRRRVVGAYSMPGVA